MSSKRSKQPARRHSRRFIKEEDEFRDEVTPTTTSALRRPSAPESSIKLRSSSLGDKTPNSSYGADQRELQEVDDIVIQKHIETADTSVEVFQQPVYSHSSLATRPTSYYQMPPPRFTSVVPHPQELQPKSINIAVTDNLGTTSYPMRVYASSRRFVLHNGTRGVTVPDPVALINGLSADEKRIAVLTPAALSQVVSCFSQPEQYLPEKLTLFFLGMSNSDRPLTHDWFREIMTMKNQEKDAPPNQASYTKLPIPGVQLQQEHYNHQDRISHNQETTSNALEALLAGKEVFGGWDLILQLKDAVMDKDFPNEPALKNLKFLISPMKNGTFGR